MFPKLYDFSRDHFETSQGDTNSTDKQSDEQEVYRIYHDDRFNFGTLC
jgi:hypothetical protein